MSARIMSTSHTHVTIERLERGLVTLAYIVTRHGPQYAPLFDRIERELIAMKSGQDPIARAPGAMLDSEVRGVLTGVGNGGGRNGKRTDA
jgi:hypothetical protein